MLPKGASDWERRGHSHHRSSVVLHAGAGEEEAGIEPAPVPPDAGRAARRRAAWAVGLKLERMWRGVEAGERGGNAAATGRAPVGKQHAPAAVAQLNGAQVLRVAAQGLVARSGEAADFHVRFGASRHGAKG
jgi:hypothetical protein